MPPHLDALEFVKEHTDVRTVIVDEAHRFRNETTQSYHHLMKVCKSRKVILLTDLFSLIELFIVPKKSSIVIDEDLYGRFEGYEREYQKIAHIRHYHNSKDKRRRERTVKYYREPRLFIKR